jgi:hypothetical protein
VTRARVGTGGYAVLKGIQGGMHLPGPKMIPSFAALREYGNTSCSTTWYVMSYIETCDKVKQGDRIMQVRSLSVYRGSGEGAQHLDALLLVACCMLMVCMHRLLIPKLLGM